MLNSLLLTRAAVSVQNTTVLHICINCIECSCASIAVVWLKVLGTVVLLWFLLCSSSFSDLYASFVSHRYMAIYHHGGVYADMDTECKRPIETWVKPGCQLVVAVQDDEYFCQWAFAGTPRHPALQAVLDLVLHRMIHKTVSPEEGDYVFKVTGPGVFTEGLRAYLGLQTDEKLKGFVEEKGRVMKDGVCLISRAELKRALRNMYSSTNKWLQGGTWSGWVTAQDSLIGINGKA